jgi:hypothetical protein
MGWVVGADGAVAELDDGGAEAVVVSVRVSVRVQAVAWWRWREREAERRRGGQKFIGRYFF